MKNAWSRSVIFRHGQCDPAGIVYTPEFFNVFNQVIEAFFCERLGINYYDILGRRRTGLGYVQTSATFFTPCMMGEEVEVFVSVGRVGRKSYQLELCAMKGDTEALRGDFTIVTTSLETHQSIEIPHDIKDALLAYATSNI
ncbi:thioesterase family protein [Sulfitobacter sp. F26204]|uniref:acyl-CoA thioesterase n=1 Tax=Sulfitobacter sp. F26204 TaxID=2996014 RepID=UPI00225E1A14|nr:thioesterase family protein [Sulfitobacter sp. F26204]MCX7560591.1 thioesterase family protein [Sulfitobacter sp. F26204]